MARDLHGTRKTDMTNLRAKLVALTIVDEAGARLFDTSDMDRLGLKSAAAIERAIQKLPIKARFIAREEGF